MNSPGARGACRDFLNLIGRTAMYIAHMVINILVMILGLMLVTSQTPIQTLIGIVVIGVALHMMILNTKEYFNG